MTGQEKDVNIDETLDGPYGLTIVQKKNGYRYSLDSLLLAEFVATSANMKVADLGTGSGVIAIVLAKKAKVGKVVGIELQRELAETARRNVELNGMGDIIEIVELDLRHVKTHFPCRSFDYVLSNPPYREKDAGKIAPNKEKAIARHEISCTMEDVLDAMKYLLKPQKKGACIYPSWRLAELFTQSRKRRLEPKRIRFVHPSPDEGSELVMVEFTKEGKPGLEALPPIFTSLLEEKVPDNEDE